jgi:hypothetical protein
MSRVRRYVALYLYTTLSPDEEEFSAKLARKLTSVILANELFDVNFEYATTIVEVFKPYGLTLDMLRDILNKPSLDPLETISKKEFVDNLGVLIHVLDHKKLLSFEE